MRKICCLAKFSSAKIPLAPVQTYLLDGFAQTIPKEITINKDELTKYYRQLTTMRDMELACDKLYKQKLIRGFCHLYLGQESIAEGMEAALTYDDPLIGAYRIHCQAYKRGFTVREIVSQMLGKLNGATKGKGGSMHYYKKASNFYGGNGIVGAQIPVGTGLAFALKYQKKPNVAVIMYGDGAANQGQLFEAMNMAKLWNLPAVYVCENNLYGMGTSVQRASMNPLLYTRGDRIPGIRCDGNNVFEVREITKWAKNFSINHGPIILEFMTYRYSGHSMSDPGTTYRTRDQVKARRQQKDPLIVLERIGVSNKLVTTEQLNKIQEQQSTYVSQQVDLALKDPQNDLKEVFTHVYSDNQKHFIRGKLIDQSQNPNP